MGNIHIVWQDWTNGWWGIDTEVMYKSFVKPLPPSKEIPGFSILPNLLIVIVLGVTVTLIKKEIK